MVALARVGSDFSGICMNCVIKSIKSKSNKMLLMERNSDRKKLDLLYTSSSDTIDENKNRNHAAKEVTVDAIKSKLNSLNLKLHRKDICSVFS